MYGLFIRKVGTGRDLPLPSALFRTFFIKNNDRSRSAGSAVVVTREVRAE
ncbi:MAG: hypothetical protein UT02_C0047G0004 [Parcubacteria group bacterium GW2011_GWC2_38_7]|nr:MAG: hypothetical protein UT02_C0047G0004 [Parcubacteria group bacterium GW2011_GWC2_38_7]